MNSLDGARDGQDTPREAEHLLQPAQDGKRVTVMLAAFEGWNDAGEAASDALRYLNKLWQGKKVATVDADDYYDFQFTRPTVRRTASGERRVKWPSTRLYRASVPDSNVDVVVVLGTEPSYRWRAYTAELLVHAEALKVDYVVLLGALLADVPHSRPIPVSATTEDSALRQRLNLEVSQYEGPVGIVGVLAEFAMLAGLPTLSLWAAVPHYVSQAPSPKAQLAILHKVEDLLQLPLDTQALAEDAEAWERGVNELATDDPEIAAYVRQLEEAKDTADLPEATGESIAREFERYLKRRGKGKP
ncbi:PAC2 family protein [Arthrobacter cupressi]|uniref:PAC2 family protein n=1 Tax=Arthrobacter cupressi TaxID=1045773 RepID=A0A1G8WNY5_9MICC|nr:PAC2 family protein [Arthrobacter cupressi]NYD79853.1 proteasome assembly chaperone (PAC2) family protein [Arthrobacter cupressi]SDJ79836.1 PAC2 family protein [Arthrobacter cupressi]